jgi:rhodanese-related sulfurtransferase
MNKVLVLLLFPLLVFTQEKDSFYELVSYDTYKNKISSKDALVFDVRTTEEFNLGHIKGSINIDFYDEKLFVKFFQKINKTKPIYIYCRSGNRSKKSSKILKEIGFVKVYDLLGGYKNWIKNGN